VDFIEQVRHALPVAIQRIQTDHGSEFGTDLTWHLHDLGIMHKRIPPGCPEANGNVERSHRTDEDESTPYPPFGPGRSSPAHSANGSGSTTTGVCTRARRQDPV
jgi:hypothetical protein